MYYTLFLVLFAILIGTVILLALDSGLERTGYAIIHHDNATPELIAYGCIETDKKDTLPHRILVLADRLGELLSRYKPTTVVLEKLFFHSNQKTASSVYQAQGATILTATRHKTDIVFMTPLEIKGAITGYGRADKLQVQKMLKLLLNIETLPKLDDVCDAIACGLAYCTRVKMRDVSRLAG